MSEQLFGGTFARGGAAREVSDRAWLQAMLDFEAALARACARAGLMPVAAAEEIAAACDAALFDVAAIGHDGAATGNPVVPMLGALRARLGEDLAGHVHTGATSQDVIDTAAMLVARRAIEPILADATVAARACARLAEAHQETVMIGRTLLQQAVPITFALKAAGWLAGIVRARNHLAEISETEVALQFGGAAGTLASLGDAGPRVTEELARELGLAAPVLPWHTERSRPALIGCALALLAGAVGKVARDVTLLAQNEVREVREGVDGRGGSSTMAHKRNPVAAVSVLACAQRLPGLHATLLASMVQEHERAAGAWHAEWETLSDALRLTGSAVAWAADMLDHLEVDAARMREHVDEGASAETGVGWAREFVNRALTDYGSV